MAGHSEEKNKRGQIVIMSMSPTGADTHVTKTTGNGDQDLIVI